MHARFSPFAEADLDNLYNYIAKDQPNVADMVIVRILFAVETLEAFPLIGKQGRVKTTRELVVPSTPFILIYTLPDQYHIDIERILHGAMLWPPEEV